MSSDQALGARLAEVRGARGLSREDLRRIAGVSYAFIQQWETGVRSQPGVLHALKVAEALDVTLDELVALPAGAPISPPGQRARMRALLISLGGLPSAAASRAGAALSQAAQSVFRRPGQPGDNAADVVRQQVLELIEDLDEEGLQDVLIVLRRYLGAVRPSTAS